VAHAQVTAEPRVAVPPCPRPARAGVGAVALGALAPASALALDPRGWHPFGPVKWLAVVLLGGLGAALVAGPGCHRLPPPLRRASALLVAWLAVAALVGEDPWFAWVGTPERRFGWVTWALCLALLHAGAALIRPRPVVAGVLVAGVGLGGLATVEALGWEPEVFAVADRLSASLGSPAYLGALAVLLLPAAAGAALDRELPVRLRIAGRLATPLLAVALVGSGARAAWLGLAVASATAAGCHRDRLRADPTRTAAGTALALAALALVALLTPVGPRLASLLDDAAPGGRGRLDEWRVAAATASDHLLTGVGPEGYRIAFHEGVDPAYEREHGRDEQPDRAHSAPLDVLLVGGVPALALWAAALLLAGRHVVAAVRTGPSWRAGIALGLVAHAAGQLALFPLAETEPLAWLLAGLVVGHAPSSTDPARPRPVPRWLRALGVAATGVLAAGALAGVVADRQAARAAAALDRGDGHAAAVAAEQALDLRPDWPRLALLGATAAVADDQGIHEALRHVRAGLGWSPGDPILRRAEVALLVDRALATGAPVHRAEARAAAEALLVADPLDSRTRAQLARLEGTER